MEIVVSIGISVLVLSALIALGSASVKTATSSSRRIEASKLSASGIEAARYVRDTLGFVELSDGCFKINGSSLDPVDGGCSNDTEGWETITLPNGEQFERRIEIKPYPDGTSSENAVSRIVVSETRWPEALGGIIGSDEEGFKKVTLTIVLSNWQDE